MKRAMNNKERSHLRRAYEQTTRFNQFKLIIVSLLLIVYSFLLVVVIPIQTYYVLIKRSDMLIPALQCKAIEAMQSFVQNLPDEMSVPNISSRASHSSNKLYCLSGPVMGWHCGGNAYFDLDVLVCAFNKTSKRIHRSLTA